MEPAKNVTESDYGTNCRDCERYKTLGEVCVIEHGKRFLWEYCRDFQPQVVLPDYNDLMRTVKQEMALERRKLREKKERERRKKQKEREEKKAQKKREKRLAKLRKKREDLRKAKNAKGGTKKPKPTDDSKPGVGLQAKTKLLPKSRASKKEGTPKTTAGSKLEVPKSKKSGRTAAKSLPSAKSAEDSESIAPPAPSSQEPLN